MIAIYFHINIDFRYLILNWKTWLTSTTTHKSNQSFKVSFHFCIRKKYLMKMNFSIQNLDQVSNHQELWYIVPVPKSNAISETILIILWNRKVLCVTIKNDDWWFLYEFPRIHKRIQGRISLFRVYILMMEGVLVEVGCSCHTNTTELNSDDSKIYISFDMNDFN